MREREEAGGSCSLERRRSLRFGGWLGKRCTHPTDLGDAIGTLRQCVRSGNPVAVGGGGCLRLRSTSYIPYDSLVFSISSGTTINDNSNRHGSKFCAIEDISCQKVEILDKIR